ncbi:MAG: hypothetical protein M3O30_15270 [Planctomycetota bacterium]|nr:hypothetical protein [Planctomycetota bacterium]
MRRKVCCGLIASLAIFSATPSNQAQTATASGSTINAAAKSALMDACNALLAASARRPYGMGWSVEGDGASLQGPTIDLRPGATPAAGLVLFRAGKMLGDSKLIEDAIAVAHGIALCQRDSGRIADAAIFARFPSPQDLSPGARDRASSTAALGLFLEILNNSPEPDQRIKSAAVRCVTWLTEQQLRDGAWPTELILDDSAHPDRVYRLDSTDWRNCTMALLLAGNVLERPTMTQRGEAACNSLIKLQLSDAKARWANGAWASAYRINYSPLKTAGEIPYVLDTVATMHAAQTLLGRFLLTQDTASSDALTQMAFSMKALRTESGDWYRFYALPSSPMIAATRSTQPSTSTSIAPAAAEPSTRVSVASSRPGDQSGMAAPGLGEILAEIDRLQQTGTVDAPRRYVQEQMAATLCGLTDMPFVPALQLESHQKDWQGSWLRLQARAIYSLLDQMRQADGN